jgi:cardiolipin synthase (CMP-forming)
MDMKILINAITLYRLISAPVLLILLVRGHFEWFRWLIVISYLTDAVDGTLARKFKVTSNYGARLDSIADDATVLVSVIALLTFYRGFVIEHLIIILVMAVLYLTQNVLALVVYRRLTSFHTVLAKTSAVLQGVFFIMMFFNLPYAPHIFYPTVIFTILGLVEEIIIVAVLPEWSTNVKGLYWILRGLTGSEGVPSVRTGRRINRQKPSDRVI